MSDPQAEPVFHTRRATPADTPLIVSHRRAMFEAMRLGAPEVLDEIVRAFEPWLRPRLADGRYNGWITSEADTAIASAGLLILDWPALPRDPSGTERGYVLNIFVEPEYRRRGLARALVGLCLAEARRRNIRVVTLHASQEGRPLYESLGFKPSNEMLFTDSATTP